MKRKMMLVKSTFSPSAKPGVKGLLTDVQELILAARQSVATTVNSTLTLLYWEIGRRIREDVLKSKRAGYGEQIVSALGRQLERDFGRGYGEKNLRRMIQFAEVFPDREIVVSLIRQLTWTHLRRILHQDDTLRAEPGFVTQIVATLSRQLVLSGEFA